MNRAAGLLEFNFLADLCDFAYFRYGGLVSFFRNAIIHPGTCIGFALFVLAYVGLNVLGHDVSVSDRSRWAGGLLFVCSLRDSLFIGTLHHIFVVIAVCICAKSNVSSDTD